jgi:hypothetical protein
MGISLHINGTFSPTNSGLTASTATALQDQLELDLNM